MHVHVFAQAKDGVLLGVAKVHPDTARSDPISLVRADDAGMHWRTHEPIPCGERGFEYVLVVEKQTSGGVLNMLLGSLGVSGPECEESVPRRCVPRCRAGERAHWFDMGTDVPIVEHECPLHLRPGVILESLARDFSANRGAIIQLLDEASKERPDVDFSLAIEHMMANQLATEQLQCAIEVVGRGLASVPDAILLDALNVLPLPTLGLRPSERDALKKLVRASPKDGAMWIAALR